MTTCLLPPPLVSRIHQDVVILQPDFQTLNLPTTRVGVIRVSSYLNMALIRFQPSTCYIGPSKGPPA